MPKKYCNHVNLPDILLDFKESQYRDGSTKAKSTDHTTVSAEACKIRLSNKASAFLLQFGLFWTTDTDELCFFLGFLLLASQSWFFFRRSLRRWGMTDNDNRTISDREVWTVSFCFGPFRCRWSFLTWWTVGTRGSRRWAHSHASSRWWRSWLTLLLLCGTGFLGLWALLPGTPLCWSWFFILLSFLSGLRYLSNNNQQWMKRWISQTQKLTFFSFFLYIALQWYCERIWFGFFFYFVSL